MMGVRESSGCLAVAFTGGFSDWTHGNGMSRWRHDRCRAQVSSGRISANCTEKRAT
jgi:hypothetical protein